MNSEPNILLVTSDPSACSHFLKQLGQAGSHSVMSSSAEGAARMLLAGVAVDVILIHHQSISGASLISCALKVISPLTPVIVVTAEWPENLAFPAGVDAVCYASSLGRRVARDITRFARYLLIEQPSQRIENAAYEGERFVPRKPDCPN